MTYPVGTRVRVRRAAPSTRARVGDIGTVYGTSYNSGGPTYQVRVEREFDRSTLQRSRGFDFTFEETAIRRLRAGETETPTSDVTFAVGDRVRLRNGEVSLSSHGITDPVGTEGTIAIVRTGERLSNKYSVQTVGHRWAVYADQVEAIPAAATPAPAVERNPTVAVGDRVTATEVIHVPDAVGKSGEVVGVSRHTLNVRFDDDIPNYNGYRSPNQTWSVDGWTREVVAQLTWVAATNENAVTGARVRYVRDVSVGTVMQGDEGVIVSNDSSSIRVFMHSPRSESRPQTSVAGPYHWSVSLRDLEVSSTPATTAPTETPLDPSGAVTFTDEQKREIARIARQYGNAHGFRGMADGIMRELGVDTAPTTRRVRLSLELELDLSGTDEYTLPEDAGDLSGLVRISQVASAVDGILNRRVVRAPGQGVTVIRRNFSYLD